MQLDVLFFYLKSELRSSGDDYEGFIRLADAHNKKHIEKLEVSNVLETFNYLKERLFKHCLISNHENIPDSVQCFGIMWDDETSKLISESPCPICKEIVDHIQEYVGYVRQSSRFVKVEECLS